MRSKYLDTLGLLASASSSVAGTSFRNTYTRFFHRRSFHCVLSFIMEFSPPCYVLSHPNTPLLSVPFNYSYRITSIRHVALFEFFFRDDENVDEDEMIRLSSCRIKRRWDPFPYGKGASYLIDVINSATPSIGT